MQSSGRGETKVGLACRGRYALLAAAMLIVATAALSVSTAAGGTVVTSAATATADFDVTSVGFGPPPLAGIPFEVEIRILNGGPDAASARLLVDLPIGVTAITPMNGIGCPAGDGTLDCGPQDLAPSFGHFDFGSFRADEAGSYTISVRVTELTATDPHLSDNTASLTIVVKAPTPTVRGFVISPVRPRAGVPVKASFAIVDQATKRRLVPSAVGCAARAGSTRVRGRGSVQRARATCTFFPPLSAKGKTLRGTITANVAGKRLAKVFAVPLR